jgi:hypothetical protein
LLAAAHCSDAQRLQKQQSWPGTRRACACAGCPCPAQCDGRRCLQAEVAVMQALAGRVDSSAVLRYKKKMVMWGPEVMGYCCMTMMLRNGLAAAAQGEVVFCTFCETLARRWGLDDSAVTQVSVGWLGGLQGGGLCVLDDGRSCLPAWLPRRGCSARRCGVMGAPSSTEWQRPPAGWAHALVDWRGHKLGRQHTSQLNRAHVACRA